MRKNKKRKGNLWRESWNYLKDTRNYIYLAVALFFAGAFVTFAFPGNFTFFDGFLTELIDKIRDLSLPALIWFIFQNNVSTAFFSMIFGVFLGIFPIFNALTNGAVLGYVYARASSVEGLGVIWMLFPHGIFELPAIFIALGLGIRLGMFAFAGKGRVRKEFKKRFLGSIKVFFTMVLPLLVVAAIIEGFLIFAGK